MRRWSLLFLVALLAVLAAVLIAPSQAMAMAATSPSMNFSGKAVAKNSDTHYFVVSFTCSPPVTTGTGTLSGKWTYEVDSMHSYTGILGSAGCALYPTILANGEVTWSTSSDDMCPLPLPPLKMPLMSGGSNVGTLSLCLTDVGIRKTFFPPPLPTSCPTNPPSACIEVQTSALMNLVPPPQENPPAFYLPSSDLRYAGSYATLNLSVG